MLGFNSIAESAICEDGSIGSPEGVVSVAGPLGAALVLCAAVAGMAVSSSVLRQPSVVAFRTVSGPASAPALLSQPVVFGSGAAGFVSLPSLLGKPRASGSIPIAGWAAAGHVLGQPRGVGYHDFTGQLGDVVTTYVMDLIVGGSPVRVPISSWQATLQTGASCYVQCVVPAVLEWTTEVNTATEFVISRVAQGPSGDIEYEMARSPLTQVSTAKGPTNFTATLSGYADAFATDEAPPTTFDRILTGIRSITTGTSPTRVRSAIDWLLRPGQRAYYADGSSFVVSYINYYVPTGNDAYMDVGE
jgi:hypothetical protein